jgi:hypothetical protein
VETHVSRPSQDTDVQRPAARFCSRCGRPASQAAGDRVCRACGLGLLLWCPEHAAPGPAGAFLVVGHDLRVRAVSEAGEGLFGPEHGAIGSFVLMLMESPLGPDRLARTIRRAALRPGPATDVRLRAAGSDDPFALGQVVTCGPPRAALISVAAAALPFA